MRNLKKFLALVLAMMMVMGLMVTANAASPTAGFKDAGAVDAEHQEAMDLMVALKIIGGVGGNKLDPDGPFTRAELATMMYKIKTGDAAGTNPQVDFYENEKIFTDVVPGKWHTKYINYVSEMGWVAGVGDGKFDPDRNITVSEVVVAMVNVLDMGLEDGAAWIEKLTAAADKGFLDGTDGLSGNASRQIAAQVMFNAMKYSPTGGTEYTVKCPNTTKHPENPEGFTFKTKDKAVAIAVFDMHSGCASEDKVPTLDEAPSDEGSLLREVYKVAKEGGSRDVYQRHTVKYVKTTPDATVVYETLVAPDYYFDGNMTGKDAKALGKDAKGTTGETYHIWYNGGELLTMEFKAITDPTGQPDGLWLDDSTGVPGYEIFIYENSKTDYDVIVREAYLGCVVAAEKEGEDITLYVYEVGGDAVTNIVVTSDQDIYEVLAAYEDGAYVAAYVSQALVDYDEEDDADDYILEIADLTVVETTITRINDKGSNIESTLVTKAGTYRVNNEAAWTDGETVGAPGFDNGQSDSDGEDTRNIHTGAATLYVLGKSVLAIEQAAAETEEEDDTTHYGYMIDTWVIAGTSGWKTEMETEMGKAKLWLEDGKEHEVYVAYYGDDNEDPFDTPYECVGENETDPTATGEAFDVTNGGIFVKYEVAEDEDGKVYYKVQVADGNGVDRVVDETGEGDTNVLSIKKNVAQGTVPGSDDVENVVFDAETTFYIITGQPGKEKVKVVTGILDVDSYDTLDKDIKYNAKADAEPAAHDETYTVGLVAVALREDVTSEKVVQAIVLRNPSLKETKDTKPAEGLYFIVGATKVTFVTVYIDEDTSINFYQYNAVVDGVITEVLVNEKIEDDEMALSSVQFVEAALKAGTEVVNITDVEDSPQSPFAAITTLDLSDMDRKVIILDADTDGYVVTEDLVVFQYDNSEGTVKEITIDDVNGDMTGYYVLEKGVLVALYVTESAD